MSKSTPKSAAKANKAVEKATKAAKAVKVPKPPKAEKPARVKGEEKNGICRPVADGATKNVWAIADKLSAKNKRPALRSEVIPACEAEGINTATATTQYGRWRVFNGLVGRSPRPAKEKPAKAEKAPKAEKPAKVKKSAVPPPPAPADADTGVE